MRFSPLYIVALALWLGLSNAGCNGDVTFARPPCVPEGGASRWYVVNKLTLPRSGAQFQYDVFGDAPAPKNRFGQIIQQGIFSVYGMSFDFQPAVDEFFAKGLLVPLLHVTESVDGACAQITLQLSSGQSLAGDGTYATLLGNAPARMNAMKKNGAWETPAGRAIAPEGSQKADLVIPLSYTSTAIPNNPLQFDARLTIPLRGLHVTASASGGGISGEIHGVLSQRDMTVSLAERLALALTTFIRSGHPAVNYLLMLGIANCNINKTSCCLAGADNRGCHLQAAELASSRAGQYLDMDFSAFSEGRFAPRPLQAGETGDAVAFGFQYTATPILGVKESCPAGALCQDDVAQSKVGAGAALRSVWGDQWSDLWAVGEKGVILHHVLRPEGLGWYKQNVVMGNNDLIAVWGRGPQDVWFAGKANVLHFDGFVFQQLVPNDLPATFGNAIWGDPDGGLRIATGEPTDQLFSLVGSTWTAAYPDPKKKDQLHALFGTSSADIWVGGSSSILTHFDGGKWGSATFGEGVPRILTLSSIWGAGAASYWGVGAPNGTFLRYDGNKDLTWTDATPQLPVALRDKGFSGVSGSGPNDVWAAGDGGVVAHFDGAAWSAIPGGSLTKDYKGVFLVEPGSVWIVGNDGALVRYQP